MNKIYKNQVNYFLNLHLKIIKYFLNLELESNFQTKSQLENKHCSCSNISTNEIKQAFDAERKEYEKKLEKLIKSQLDPLVHGRRSNDLEIAVSRLRAERDEYLYEINCLKKQHNIEVIFITFISFENIRFVDILVFRLQI